MFAKNERMSTEKKFEKNKKIMLDKWDLWCYHMQAV
jgi:hypothetical protein